MGMSSCESFSEMIQCTKASATSKSDTFAKERTIATVLEDLIVIREGERKAAVNTRNQAGSLAGLYCHKTVSTDRGLREQAPSSQARHDLASIKRVADRELAVLSRT